MAATAAVAVRKNKSAIQNTKPQATKPNGRDHGAGADSFLLERLALSCIGHAEARYAGIQAMTLEQAQHAGLELPAYCTDGFVLPYYDITGKSVNFWRWRNNPACVRGFARNTKDPLHGIKYGQPKGSGCWIYYPRIEGLNWQQVIANPKVPVVIVEGELKALCLCLRGVFAVGVGGVWNFTVRKELLPELAQLASGGRELAILFDSDTEDKPLCCGARYHMARQLLDARGNVHVLLMPKLLSNDTKTGADDFCRLHPRLRGPKLWPALLALEDTEAFKIAAELYRLNAEYVINEPAGRIVRIGDGAEWDDQKFVRLIENRTVLGTNKAGEPKEVHVGKQWVQLPWRNRVQGRVYQPISQFCNPDALTYVYLPDGRRMLNNFTGWATVPAATDRGLAMVKRFWTALLDHHFRQQHDETPEETARREFCRRWFEQWWAYPVQNPGAKMHSCCVLAGEQGGGKGLVGYMVQHAVYGRHFREVTQKDLDGNFNGSYIEDVGLLMGSEITTTSTRFDMAAWFKHFVTSEDIQVKRKYVPEYYIPNRMNAYFTTNYEDAFFLDDNDRRYFMWNIPPVKLLDAAGFGDNWVEACVVAFQRDPEFQAALHWWLLHLPMEGFDHKRPPETPAKQVAKTFSHNAADAFVDQYLQEQTEKGCTVFRFEQALKVFQHDEANKRMGEKALLKAWRKRLFYVGRGLVKITEWVNSAKSPELVTHSVKVGLWTYKPTYDKGKTVGFMTISEARRLYEEQWAVANPAPKPTKY